LRAQLAGLLLAFLGLASTHAAVPVGGYKIQRVYPHDTGAFTEGLLYLDGDIIESTGQTGASSIRRVRLADGAVLQSAKAPAEVFGEGVVNWGDRLYSLTWQDEIGFVWDRKTFKRLSNFHYSGEGWALTQSGKQLIMSDGTATLKFLDPKSLKVVRRLQITADGRPVTRLNELEWVKGEIFANVWMTNRIARIDPVTGRVRAWLDLTGLPETLLHGDLDAVLNGIAYDPVQDRLFVTGKMWPHLYQISLSPLEGAHR
jgi:glutaminyl-peptide cyclotransferase